VGRREDFQELGEKLAKGRFWKLTLMRFEICGGNDDDDGDFDEKLSLRSTGVLLEGEDIVQFCLGTCLRLSHSINTLIVEVLEIFRELVI
jgi:hypothetical protein